MLHILDDPVDGLASLHPGRQGIADLPKQPEITYLRQGVAQAGPGVEQVDELSTGHDCPLSLVA